MTHTDIFTTAGVGAALVSPWWLPALQAANTVAAWALPILGCLWFLMQMYYKHKKENPRT